MNYLDELYNLAREIDAATAAVAQAARNAERQPLQLRLPGDLGSITVSGAGELTAVTLDGAELHQYSADALSRALLRGIQEAETQAEHRRAGAVGVAVAETELT